MTAEEVFRDLNEKYGDDFNWFILSVSDNTFVAELKREIGQNHFLYDEQIRAIAKCDSNDDVLFWAGDENGTEIYYIFHLTYAKQNSEGFPEYKKFAGIEAVKKYIEKIYVEEYL